jgi:hypothetical protein
MKLVYNKKENDLIKMNKFYFKNFSMWHIFNEIKGKDIYKSMKWNMLAVD